VTNWKAARSRFWFPVSREWPDARQPDRHRLAGVQHQPANPAISSSGTTRAWSNTINRLACRPCPLARNQLPAAIKRIRTFDGKLYALDPNAQQIMKYEPVDAGYPNAPAPYLAESHPELAKATDLAIDGTIYVTLSDRQNLEIHRRQIGHIRPARFGRPIAAAGDHRRRSKRTGQFAVRSRRSAPAHRAAAGRWVVRAPVSRRRCRVRHIQDLLVDEQNIGCISLTGRGIYPGPAAGALIGSSSIGRKSNALAHSRRTF